MVGDHHTSERVYAVLKADLLDRPKSSDRLNINALALQYDASTTPVREALLRLVGEGLVEMPAAGGFVLPSIDMKAAHDHYELALALALMAASQADLAPTTPPSVAGLSRLRVPIDAILVDLAERSGNPIMVQAIMSSNDRMHSIRRLEEMRLGNLDKEISAMQQVIEERNKKTIKIRITAYYRRRQRNVAKIMGLSA